MASKTRSEWNVSVASEIRQGEWMEDSYAMKTVFWLTVTNAQGRRFDHAWTFEVYGVRNDFHGTEEGERIGRLYDRVMAAIIFGTNGKVFSPEGKEVWQEGRPVYGSESYSRTGGDRTWQSDLEPALLYDYWQDKERATCEHEWMNEGR